MTSQAKKKLQTFPNPSLKRDYQIHIEMPEFTCLCPLTGQPDFATMILDYIPDQSCIELKSLKTYIWSYRNEGAFHEAVTNQIADDLIAALTPRYLKLTAKFYVRGGLFTNVIVEYRQAQWLPQPSINLEQFSPANPTVD
ncbi:MAG: preQ(1) synthase [Proteobacteria bacterium]|nr:preQ(1) synthase [Pseudomonadota bacterium]MDE3207437.1 NADPH-dependent 7-cyano-7-deazaguanine reductase QueF [Pseudomonadota bacterium]